MNQFTKRLFVFGTIIVSSIWGVFSQDIDNVVQLTPNGHLDISDLEINTENVDLYEKFEITFNLSGEWVNPYDPDQIKVDAVLTVKVIPSRMSQIFTTNLSGKLESIGYLWQLIPYANRRIKSRYVIRLYEKILNEFII